MGAIWPDRRSGDKVIPLEARLVSLERRTSLTLYATTVLVILHLPVLSPALDWATHAGWAFVHVATALV